MFMLTLFIVAVFANGDAEAAGEGEAAAGHEASVLRRPISSSSNVKRKLHAVNGWHASRSDAPKYGSSRRIPTRHESAADYGSSELNQHQHATHEQTAADASRPSQSSSH